MKNSNQIDEEQETNNKNLYVPGDFLKQNSLNSEENQVEESQCNLNADINQLPEGEDAFKHQNQNIEQRAGGNQFNNLIKHKQDPYNSRVTQNIKSKISSKKKDPAKINFVQANKSMLNNTNKLSPQNQLNIENIYKKQAERMQYNLIERSPRGDQDTAGGQQIIGRAGCTTERGDESNNQHLNASTNWASRGNAQGPAALSVDRSGPPLLINSSNNLETDGARDPSDRKQTGSAHLAKDNQTAPQWDNNLPPNFVKDGAVYYGDLNVDQNGQVVDDYQSQPVGVPNLNLEGAVNQGARIGQEPRSKNTRRKKLRSMDNKIKNGAKSRSIKQQIREAQDVNEAYYKQSFGEFGGQAKNGRYQQAQLSPKYSGGGSPANKNMDGKVIKIGAVLGNVNIITQNHNSKPPNSNQDSSGPPQDGNNDLQGDYMIGEPVETNQVLSGADLNDLNEENEYLQRDAGKYATGGRLKSKTQRRQQPLKKKRASTGLEDEASPYAGRTSSNNQKLKAPNVRDKSQRQSKQYKRQANDSKAEQLEDIAESNADRSSNVVTDVLNGLEKGYQKISDQQYQQFDSMDSARANQDRQRAGGDDQVNYDDENLRLTENRESPPDLQDKVDVSYDEGDYRSQVVATSLVHGQKYLKHDLLNKAQPKNSIHYHQHFGSEEPSMERGDQKAFKYQRQTQQIMNIRRAYDQHPHNSQLSQKRNEPIPMSLMQNTFMRSSNGPRISNQHRGFASSFTNQGAYTHTNTRSQTRGQSDKDANTTSGGMIPTALPSISKPLSREQTQENETTDFLQKQDVFSQNKAKYGKSLLANEDTRYDFRKKKNLTNISRIEALARDIKSKQIWQNKGNISVDLDKSPQFQQTQAEQRQNSILESFDQKLQPNYQGALDSARRRPKTKQVGYGGYYDQREKYMAYKLVPANFKPAAEKKYKKQVLSSSLLDVKNKAQQEILRIDPVRKSKNKLQSSIDYRPPQRSNQYENYDIIPPVDPEIANQDQQILNASHPMSPNSLRLRQEVINLQNQNKTRKNKNNNSFLGYSQERFRDKNKSITKPLKQTQTDRKKSKHKKILAEHQMRESTQNGGDIDPTEQTNDAEDALEAQDSIPNARQHQDQYHQVTQKGLDGLKSQQNESENLEMLNKSIEQSSQQEDGKVLYQKIKHKTQTNWNLGSQNLMNQSQYQTQQDIQQHAIKSTEERVINQTQPGTSNNDLDSYPNKRYIENINYAQSAIVSAQVNINQSTGFEGETNTKGTKRSKQSVAQQTQSMLDPKTVQQTEKLKKIVISKQQMNKGLRENLKRLNDSQNTAAGGDQNLNRVGKTPIGPIQEIKSSYFAGKPNNQQKRRMDPVTLLNQKELKIMNDIKQKSATNLPNLHKRSQVQQSGPKQSLSPSARKVSPDQVPIQKQQERHHSVLTGKNHIELNKQLRDHSNFSQLSRISRLTDRQNAVGPRLASRQLARQESESKVGAGGVSQSQFANKESVQSEQNAITQHRYSQAQNEQIENQDAPYDDVININLPSARQKSKPGNQARKAQKNSKEAPSGSPIADTKQTPLTKATEKATLQKKETNNTKTPITKPLDLTKVSKAREEGERKERLERQRRDRKAAEEQHTKRGKATSSIKAINKRLYYDRKFGPGNKDIFQQANEEFRRFTDVRLEHGRLSLSRERADGEHKGNKLKSPTALRPIKERGEAKDPNNQEGAKGKHVKFQNQTDRTPEIAAEYRKKAGRASKFIQHNSPIDRYYRMYVTGADARVFDAPVGALRLGQSPGKLSHSKGCPHYTSRSSDSPASLKKGDDSLPSPARQKAAIDNISKAGSLEEVVRMAERDGETRTVLASRQALCDCHQRQQTMLRQRLTRQPSRAQSIAAGSIQAGDGMSMQGDFPEGGPFDYQQYFRTFRAPCRRTCSTTHNPMFHCSRFGIQMKPIRPQSAEKTKEQKQAELVKIDFAQTAINFAVRDGDRKQAASTLNGRGDSPELKLKRQNSSGAPFDRKSDFGARQTAEERELDRQDMKNLVKQLDKVEESYSRYGILTEKEVHHYYSVVRDDALKAELTAPEKKTLNKKCWKTLEHLMKSLILNDDFQIIFDSYTQKRAANELRFQNEKTPQKEIERLELEHLIKVLLRCQKMFDAKQEIVRILVKIRKREALMKQFEDEVDDCTAIRAKGYYYIVLKLSCRIYNQIERLRVDNPMLNRPFIYNRKNTQGSLVSDQLNIRENLVKRFRDLKPDLGRVLDKSGRIVKLQHIIALNQRSTVKVVKAEDGALEPAAPLDRRETLIQRHKDRLDRGEALAKMGEEEDQPNLSQSLSQTDQILATLD